MSNCRAGDVPLVFVIQAVCFILRWNFKTRIFFFLSWGEIGNTHREVPQWKHRASGGRFNTAGPTFLSGWPCWEKQKKKNHQRLIIAIEEICAIAFRFLNDFTGLRQVYSTTASDAASGNSQLWRFTAFERACVATAAFQIASSQICPVTCEPCVYACLVSVCGMVDITPDEYLQAESRTSRRALLCAGRGQLLSNSCAAVSHFALIFWCEMILHIPPRPRPYSATPETASDFNKLRAFALSMTARLPNIQMIYPADPGMIWPAV